MNGVPTRDDQSAFGLDRDPGVSVSHCFTPGVAWGVTLREKHWMVNGSGARLLLNI
jgi:hypothetical protein